MTLNARFNGEWHNAESADEVAQVLSAAIDSLEHEIPSDFVIAGTDAILCIANERFSGPFEGTQRAAGCLKVALNKSSGYGAAIWYPGADGLTWVSDNPQPPDFDPRVVADPGYPLFHHPDSTIPVEKFIEVLEEFASSGTGEKPTVVQWTRSDPCGRRQDRNMGYKFHITRAQNWLKGAKFPISQTEWESVAKSHSALLADGIGEAESSGIKATYTMQGEHVKFTWQRGRVDVVGLYTDSVKAVMADLALRLQANTFGDDEIPSASR